MKAICVINTSGNYGGAEKRIVSLFEHISRERDDFLLIINKELYCLMTEKKILSSGNNINIINIPFDKKQFSETTKGTDTKKGKSSPLRDIAGRYKYFFKTVYQWLFFSKQLKNILKKSEIKTIYTIWQGGIWGRIWFKRRKIKIIYGANSNLVWHLKQNLLNRLDSQYRILRDANIVDFLSSGLVDELRTLMPEKDFPENYSISPCSFINYDNFHPVYPKENSVVFSGRLVELKNPMLFLNAVKLFNSEYAHSSEITFHVLGTGPMETGMKRFAKENNLTNLMFEGKVSNPETFLSRSKVFVSIQQTENYPSQALIEAMACENAVIASDVGETRKLVTESEGELVQLDANKIANALTRLFSDEEALTVKGKNARKKVMAEHTIDRFKKYFHTLTD